MAIVGAGAAGLATGIFTRRFNGSLSVVLLDGARAPGAKILVSGGSRCNVTNSVVSEQDFWGGPPSIIRRVLRAFPVAATVAFFREIGINMHEEAGGKLFPDSNRAADVLNALLRETDRVGVRLAAGHRVHVVEPSTDGFTLTTNRGQLRASTLVLATGGESLPKSGSDGAGYAIARRLGHTIVPTTPALAPLQIAGADTIHAGLSGVSHEVELAVWVDGAIAIRLAGAMLWTHFGISGPVVLNASRHWLRARLENRPVALTVNFRPGDRFDDVDGAWQRMSISNPRTSVQSMLASMLPASVAGAILVRLEVDGTVPLAHFDRDNRRRLSRALVEFPLPVAGSRGYTYAEATAGGIALDEIDARTMGSRTCPGLSCVGEILDVDGRIGGFNFQWAWSSGFVAGRALASS